MEKRAFIFHIDENVEMLTPENLLFALEGVYPQIKINEIYETAIIYDDTIKDFNESKARLGDSWKNLKNVFKEALEKKKND